MKITKDQATLINLGFLLQKFERLVDITTNEQMKGIYSRTYQRYMNQYSILSDKIVKGKN